MKGIEQRLKQAIRHFWRTRDRQNQTQGAKTGRRDTGARSAVTGGKHLDGFVELCRDILIDAGLPQVDVHWSSKLQLPGYFRAEKKWDLLAVVDDQLLAVVEFKAHVGPSFGNNVNNRAEEAIGNATDLWAAYREGAYKPSARPWLGYMFILEDCPESNSPVDVREPHFGVFPEFRSTSYRKRYESLLTKLVRERLYDAACLLLTPRDQGRNGKYRVASKELSFAGFVAGLAGKAVAYSKSRAAPKRPKSNKKR
ncbi:MAG: restriction endonuclease [Planctomycetota bacterium]|nr:MAG: restriction endonuclease [Planctomycetota bacterium]REJ90059.1 MAG: restriction endonuclease [Planctomycetota bacterium]REK23139.1 MAG: restriction endonuclease [Planctomycetota bacterium]REK43414.1 MAG: restriction endonuclease [Planctomycetota bacterium]